MNIEQSSGPERIEAVAVSVEEHLVSLRRRGFKAADLAEGVLHACIAIMVSAVGTIEAAEWLRTLADGLDEQGETDTPNNASLN